MAQLEQMNLQYQPGEDRACLRISTRERCEYRFWLTRRFVRMLWPVLTQLLEAEDRVRSQPCTEARKTVLAFQREHALQTTDFRTAYREEATSFPLGEEPLLLSAVQAMRPPGASPVIRLRDPQQRGIELALTDRLLHALCSLLADVVDRAGWDLELQVAESPLETGTIAQRLN